MVPPYIINIQIYPYITKSLNHCITKCLILKKMDP